MSDGFRESVKCTSYPQLKLDLKLPVDRKWLKYFIFAIFAASLPKKKEPPSSSASRRRVSSSQLACC